MDGRRLLLAVHNEVVDCRACPRLVEWREQVAIRKRAAYLEQDYWGRPVPGFGDPLARILIVGLAPAAHGANRTGRVFTGDRSGDFLFAALHRVGLANQPEAVGLDDGLSLTDVFITAPVKCAPPANKPTPEERAACRPFFQREVAALERVSVVVVLGFGEFWDNRASANFTVNATVEPANTITPLAEVAVPAGGSAQLAAANGNRKELRVGIKADQPGGVYLGDVNVGALTPGGFIEEGGTDYITTESAVYAYNAGSDPVVVHVVSLERV
jgi:uracil-DNA glycosylase family 4